MSFTISEHDIVIPIDIDIYSDSSIPYVYMKQYDTNTRFIEVKVWNDGVEYQIPSDATIMFAATKPDGKVIADTKNIKVENNKIYYKIPFQASVVEGFFDGEFRFYRDEDDKAYSTSSVRLRTEKSTLQEKDVISADEFNVLDTLINEANRVLAELAISESIRVNDEIIRKSNEVTRQTNESNRQTQEEDRDNAENERVIAEGVRDSNEDDRILIENIRNDNEQIRIENEDDRVLAEIVRQGNIEAFKIWENYNSKKQYIPLNKVYYQGSSYINIQQCTNKLPTDTNYWLKIVDKGDKGEIGLTGNSLDYHWDGTRLGIKIEGDSDYVYVDLKGETGTMENLDATVISNALGYIPFNPSNITDNLNSVSADEALSAKQGKILNDNLTNHKTSNMPHTFKINNKDYTVGFTVVSNQPQIIYEEVL